MSGDEFVGVDIGTNTLLARLVTRDGAPRDFEYSTGLGRGAMATRVLEPEAIERALSALRDLRTKIGAAQRRVVGTSALRDARNAGDFVQPASVIMDCAVEVISGDEEARLTTRGVVSSLPSDVQRKPVTVVDIGGGSTEIIFVDHNGQRDGVSVSIGSVRLYDRVLSRRGVNNRAALDHLSDEEHADVAQTIAREAIDAIPLLRNCATLAFTGGPVTLGRLIGRTTYPSVITSAEIDDLAARIWKTEASIRRSWGLDEFRADVSPLSVAIFKKLVDLAEPNSIWIADGGVRAGLVAEFLEDLV